MNEEIKPTTTNISLVSTTTTEPKLELDTEGLPKNRNYGDLDITRNGITLTYKLRPRIKREYKGKPAPPLNMPDITEETFPTICDHYGMKMIVAWIADVVRTNNQVIGEDFYSQNLEKRDSEGYAKVLTEFTLDRETKSGLQAIHESLMKEYTEAMKHNDGTALKVIGEKIVANQIKIMNLQRKGSEE